MSRRRHIWVVEQSMPWEDDWIPRWPYTIRSDARASSRRHNLGLSKACYRVRKYVPASTEVDRLREWHDRQKAVADEVNERGGRGDKLWAQAMDALLADFSRTFLAPESPEPEEV